MTREDLNRLLINKARERLHQNPEFKEIMARMAELERELEAAAPAVFAEYCDCWSSIVHFSEDVVLDVCLRGRVISLSDWKRERQL